MSIPGVTITSFPGTWQLVNSAGAAVKIEMNLPTVRIPIGSSTTNELGYMTKQVDPVWFNGADWKVGKKIIYEVKIERAANTVVRQSVDPEQDVGQDPLATPYFGLHLMRKNMSWYDNNHRMWSTKRHEIKHGTVRGDIVLTAANFINVLGNQPSAAQFAGMLQNPGRMGFTFGGGGDYGHGVFLTTGSVKLTILKLFYQAV